MTDTVGATEKPVAWRWHHVNDAGMHWNYQESPIERHNEYLVVEALYTAPPDLSSSKTLVDRLSETLFPPMSRNSDRSYTIHCVDENLDAALYDLKRTNADAVCIRTIEEVLRRLSLARAALNKESSNA